MSCETYTQEKHMQFTYEAEIYEQLPYDETKKPLGTVRGTLEAEDAVTARQLAYGPIMARVKAIESAQGTMVGVRNVQVKYSALPDASTLTPSEYQQLALRTLYSDLTYGERLDLCALGLAGEMGEVTDLIKKFLYHRNGKPLDSEKLKDELGDILWYFFVLLDTLGLTFEAVMMTNARKLETRHPSGFQPHYASDSHASEKEQL
jgi:NTP pyrophosphatase (non-canonical NTP hydrolase)